MDTFNGISGTRYEPPLSESDQTALRSAFLRDLAAQPFIPGALISRSIWVIFVGRRGVQVRATLPIDDRVDKPDEENITSLCDLAGSLISSPLRESDEKAAIVLHRPGPTEISEADTYIFRLMHKACASRKAAPWTFHVVGPGGSREIMEHQAPPDPAG